MTGINWKTGSPIQTIAGPRGRITDGGIMPISVQLVNLLQSTHHCMPKYFGGEYILAHLRAICQYSIGQFRV